MSIDFFDLIPPGQIRNVPHPPQNGEAIAGDPGLNFGSCNHLPLKVILARKKMLIVIGTIIVKPMAGSENCDGMLL